MRTLLVILTFVLSSAHSPGAAYAQSTPPEAVARDYFAAVRAADWAEVARLTHPQTQRQVQSFLLSALPAEPGRVSFPMVTKEEVLSGLQVGSVEEVRSMDPELLLRRLLSRGVPGPMRSILVGTENDSETEILGHVAEGDSLVHVLRRARFVGPRPERPIMRQAEWEQGTRMDVVTLKRHGSAWRVVQESGFDLLMLLRTILSPA